MNAELSGKPFKLTTPEEKEASAIADQQAAIELYQRGVLIDDEMIIETALNAVEKATIIARAAQIEAVAVNN